MPPVGALAHRAVFEVGVVGHLVSRQPFVGHVHSVFAKACNVLVDAGLLTLCPPGAGCGPLTLRLAAAPGADLRECFSAGERVVGRASGLCTARAELRWLRASVWRPAPPDTLLDRARIGQRLHRACARLERHRRRHSSIIDGQGAAAVAALRQACQAMHVEQARLQAKRLLGWGEGLTPAGDDFLVGLLVGLDGETPRNAARRFLRDGLAEALLQGLTRTTDISAHYLRLAVLGHHGEPLLRLRQALISDASESFDDALGQALAIGASSGADLASGLLAGLQAWAAPALPPAPT